MEKERTIAYRTPKKNCLVHIDNAGKLHPPSAELSIRNVRIEHYTWCTIIFQQEICYTMAKRSYSSSFQQHHWYPCASKVQFYNNNNNNGKIVQISLEYKLCSLYYVVSSLECYGFQKGLSVFGLVVHTQKNVHLQQTLEKMTSAGRQERVPIRYSVAIAILRIRTHIYRKSPRHMVHVTGIVKS